jgi:hypothetical protein
MNHESIHRIKHPLPSAVSPTADREIVHPRHWGAHRICCFFFLRSVSNKIPQNRSDHVTLKSRHPGRGLKRRPIDKFRLSRRRICIGGGDAIPRFHFPTERVPAFGQKGLTASVGRPYTCPIVIGSD